MRRTVIRSISLFAIGVALASCATLDKDECAVADWQQLGMSDGGRGVAATYVANHQKACSKYGLPVDTVAWQSGWQQGIRNYCTFENGIEVGKRSGYSSNPCPADLAADFQTGVSAGSEVHQARSERDSARSELNSLTAKLVKAPDPAEKARIQLQIELTRTRLQTAEFALLRAESSLQNTVLAHSLRRY